MRGGAAVCYAAVDGAGMLVVTQMRGRRLTVVVVEMGVVVVVTWHCGGLT